jgi:hypothetical protein
MPARVSRIFFRNNREVLAINPGSFGNRAIIDIPTARTEPLGCWQLNLLSDQRRHLWASSFRFRRGLCARQSRGAEDLQLETALQRVLGQDDVAVWSREIKLVINRWNMYEPFRPAPLRFTGRHFIKKHSASTSSGDQRAKRRNENRQSDSESLNFAMLRRGAITDLACPPPKFPVVIKGVVFPKFFCRLEAFEP